MNADNEIAQGLFGNKDHHDGSSQFRDVFQDPNGGDDQRDDHVENDEPQPVCSVLNTVIDYFMAPPTPLELDEYLKSRQGRDGAVTEAADTFDSSTLPLNPEGKGENSPPLLVPVLRVFGPILRRDTTMSESILRNPTQSACLYIHNAFPYMLARPKLAGPDGSLNHQLQELQLVPGQVDWDSVESVERIIPVLHETLEATIQSSFQDFAASNTTTTSSNIRVIRKITVVCGRGFYTFCPGPPAPFLRVEYYNPSQRWKVKRVLERGLPDLPECYHPVQYNSNGDDMLEQQPQPLEGPPPPDVLQFCCYEAHIPFTMQFFKDHNLAGMSYIHLSLHGINKKNNNSGSPTLRFRKSLPQKDRPKTLQQQKSITLGEEQDLNKNDNSSNNYNLFLDSNTPDEYRWETGDIVESSSYFSAKTTSQVSQPSLNDTSSSDNRPVLQQPSLSTSSSDHVASQQQRRQRNSTPSQPWTRKETSCDVELDVSVENILNVLQVIKELPQEEESRNSTHWRAVPSLYEIWQEERRRMAKLVPPKDDFLSATTAAVAATPPSLTLNVKKNAPKPGSRLALEGMQTLLRVSPGLEQSFRRSIQQIVQRHERAIDRVDQMLFQKNRMAKMIHSTPSHDETVQALGALETLFEEPGDNDTGSSQQKEEKASSVGSQSSSQKDRFQALSQSYYDLKERPKKETEGGEFELSQRIDRGEGVVPDGAFESIDEFIDPETLTPFENIDDEDDDDELDEKGMEQMLSVLATQTMEASQAGSPNYAYDDASSVESIDLLTGNHDVFTKLTSHANAEDDDADEEEEEGVTGDDDLSRSVTSPPRLTRSMQKDQKVQIGVRLRDLSGLCVTLRATPPTRVEMSNPESVNGLLPMSSNGDVPSFMSCLAAYEEGEGRSNDGSRWLPHQQNENRVSVCLTRSPPSNITVYSWHRKQKKRTRSHNQGEITNKRQKFRQAATDLELDGNSRKLIVSAVRRPEIEEVEWDASQPNVESQTQATQDDYKKAVLQVIEVPHGEQGNHQNPSPSLKKSSSQSTGTPSHDAAIEGMGNQGGHLWIAGGGELKAKTRPSQFRNAGSQAILNQKQYLPTPVSVMVLEIHVQCRTGRAGVNDSKVIAMTPDSSRDKVSAVMYVFGRDPGGGENLETIERGCIFVPVSREVEVSSQSNVLGDLAAGVRRGMPHQVLGVSAPLSVECVRDERQLLLRLASIVRWKDPDMLLSWDTQGSGLGYLIERGVALGKDESSVHDSEVGNGTATSVSGELDLARLLSRTPRGTSQKKERAKSALENAFGEMEQSEGARNDSKISKEKDRWVGSGLGSDWDERVGAGAAAASISGRVVFAAWKIVAEEVKHPNASYQPAVVSAVLNQRIPFHDNLRLSEWYGHDRGRERWRVLHHKLVQATSCLLLFDALDIIGRSGEAARLSGVEFSQSFPGIRGSQYKVEGVLLRALQSLNSSERGSKHGSNARLSDTTKSASLSDESRTQSPWKARRRGTSVQHERNDDETKPIHELSNRSYFFYSPSLQDTNKQEALEVQALTLEPESGCYSDPVIVCDFTALYPSLVIAYNLCYSTISGRLDYHSTREEMQLEGITTGKIGPFVYSEDRSATVFKHHFRSFRENKSDRAYVAPTGSVYVSESVLKGVLPQVLDEILSTRAMLKKASKLYKQLVPNLHPSVLRQLEARQLALKYVANVTYGYTSATFSGRCAMPLLADTIVECGRRTLTNAISLANSWGKNEQNKWHGCKVIYGDTDSVFVKLPGRSVQEAFQFGEEFCKAVTAANPPPVQLKLEKVYFGSIMQTKKKYCGMKFESKDQRKPVFEAKGLETIRRDQCALTQKVLRNCLVTLFRSGIQAAKAYLYSQWRLILSGQLPVSDFILTGRVRSRYRGGRVGPVQAVLARRLAEADPGRVVRHKERIAYCIVATPGVTFRLRDCVLTPMELLEQWDAYTIHAGYYITKHVNAALQRCLGLPPYNADVNSWYDACPKPSRRIHFWPVTRSGNSIMISSFFGSDVCSLCKSKCMAPGLSRAAVCSSCRKDPVAASQQALVKLSSIQKESALVAERCKGCNMCFEDAGTFAQCRWIQQHSRKATSNSNVSDKLYSSGIVTPLANCTCIDCPLTYERHRLKELELEASALCEALGIM